MASVGYTTLGCEWKQKFLYRQDQISRDTSLEVLLYNDSSDSLDDSSDVGDINTEPTDGNYSRVTITLDGSAVSLSVQSGEVQANYEPTFDVTDTTGTIDSIAVLNDFTSDVVNSETGANTHLLYADEIGTADLANYESDFAVTTNVLEDDP